MCSLSGYIRSGLFVLLFVALAAAIPAFGQGCALCYTQAASSGRQMIEALRSGILILIIPPTLGTIGVLFLLRYRRNQIRRSEANGPRLDW
ncbi:MAG TPA: hypothetical protein VMI10_19270 [Terriglobales bacterium]|nr:hypothetical protein [Terriglobales bacterium]